VAETQPLALVYIDDRRWDTVEGITELLDDLCRLVPDNDDQLVDPSVNCRRKDIRKEWATPDLNDAFRLIISKVSESCPTPSCRDPACIRESRSATPLKLSAHHPRHILILPDRLAR